MDDNLPSNIKIAPSSKAPKSLRSHLKNAVLGLIISVVTLGFGLTILELLVRNIKPQIPFSEGIKRSDSVWKTSPYVPFTFKSNIKLDSGLIINSLGYKGEEFSITKPVGGYRILVLGDSFVAGMAQDYKLSWPWIVQKMFRDSGFNTFEVINAGFHDGYSPDSYYSYLIGEGLAIKPDFVVLGVYLQNDLSDLHSNRWVKTDPEGLPLQVVSSWRKLDPFGREVSDILPFRYRYPALGESHLWILFANWIERRLPSLVHSPAEAKKFREDQDYFGATFSQCVYVRDCFNLYFQKDFDKFKSVLSGTAKLLASRQIPLLIVWQPSIWQLKLTPGTDFPPEGTYYLQADVENYFKVNNLPASFLDLTTDYLKVSDAQQYYYPTPETHWNPQGNQFTAQLVFNKIKSLIGR
ncbi:MAG: Lipolytic protein G-D-S-L family [Microgenomates group bacterium GW2011_GWA2_44_7]|nr:MAG: Lipolytic protein G-D-S-L family [Microgenomates group bacterium GW2011_GWA2_44_7]KKT77435.1 MAG: Lipolytic protein G-D-S-L family [Microgenomates group bacterium GW2011_GWB1_44_8]